MRINNIRAGFSFFVIAMICFVIGGCIKVSSTFPAAGSTGVPEDVVISIEFSNTPNPSTVNSRSVTVKTAAGETVKGAVSCSGRKVIFNPDTVLFSDTEYKVSVKKSIRDKQGSALASDYNFSFRTAVASSLEVLNTSPANNAVGAGLDSAVKVVFSAPVNPATVNASSFTLRDEGSTPVESTISLDLNRTTAQLKPASKLSPGSTYTATLDDTVATPAGVRLSGGYSFTFTASLPGKPDYTFGSGGTVTAELAEAGESLSMAVHPSGRIMVSLTAKGVFNLDQAIMSFMDDGATDTAFGTGGTIYADFGLDDSNSYLDVDDDGYVYTAGMTLNGSQYFMNLGKFDDRGAADASFGNNGKALGFINGRDNVRTAAIQPDGKAVLAGATMSAWKNYLAIVRFTQDGLADDAFGIEGKMVEEIPDSMANSLAIQPDGKILAAGSVLKEGEDNIEDLILIRYKSDGSRDSSFGANGIVIIDLGYDEAGMGVEVLPDGKIVVAGWSCSSESMDFMVARLNSNGSLDSSFGTNGIALTDFGGNDLLRVVAVQADGRIVAAGSALAGSYSSFAVARYNADGSNDESFDSDGMAVYDLGPGCASGLVIQPDGKIVLGGLIYEGSKNIIKLLRLQP
jgi:uncharacterized delta-60 repeat protein